jgi:S1-C subfamily serine protease
MNARRIAVALLSVLCLGWASSAAHAYFPPAPPWFLGVTGYVEPVGGFRVTGVVPFSPANKAGILPGDVIVLVNGQQFWTDYEYRLLVTNSPNPIVQLTVFEVRTGWTRPGIVDLRNW